MQEKMTYKAVRRRLVQANFRSAGKHATRIIVCGTFERLDGVNPRKPPAGSGRGVGSNPWAVSDLDRYGVKFVLPQNARTLGANIRKSQDPD